MDSIVSNIENESTSVGRIDIQEFNANPDIIREKVRQGDYFLSVHASKQIRRQRVFRH